jgi:hypothetical protein
MDDVLTGHAELEGGGSSFLEVIEFFSVCGCNPIKRCRAL